jgi:hypothetical protein
MRNKEGGNKKSEEKKCNEELQTLCSSSDTLNVIKLK